jgi:hypothetical protein
MPRIRFESLLEVYRNTQFGTGGGADESRLTVASQAIAGLLALIEVDEDALSDSGITLLDDISDATVGSNIRVRIESPRAGLGVLARTMDGLLAAPTARVEEPKHYYLVAPPYAPGDPDEPVLIARYRTVIALIRLFAKASSFLDAIRAELVFVKESRLVVPIRFDAADLSTLVVADAKRLLAQFDGDLHQDQKHEILFAAIIDLCSAQPAELRFGFVLRNLGHLADQVREGYKLFASSFTYAKIRGALEDARIEYTGKIHKTIVDIQNQLLGIPVATVVVASQMKTPTACGIEPWVNFAVLIGAWTFVLLLALAIGNQWLTLGVLKDELSRQKTKLLGNFAIDNPDFVRTFDSLNHRIFWHRSGLGAVGVIGLIGALLATYFYLQIAAIPVPKCIVPPDNSSTTGSSSPSPAQVRGAPTAPGAGPTSPTTTPPSAAARPAANPSPSLPSQTPALPSKQPPGNQPPQPAPASNSAPHA